MTDRPLAWLEVVALRHLPRDHCPGANVSGDHYRDLLRRHVRVRAARRFPDAIAGAHHHKCDGTGTLESAYCMHCTASPCYTRSAAVNIWRLRLRECIQGMDSPASYVVKRTYRQAAPLQRTGYGKQQCLAACMDGWARDGERGAIRSGIGSRGVGAGRLAMAYYGAGTEA